MQRRVALIEVELAALRARVDRLEQRRRRPDASQDGALLSAIAATIGAEVFSATDLLSRRGELAALLDGLDARRVGAWLRRIHRRPDRVSPYHLVRISRDDRGIVWAVDRAHTR